MAEWRFLRGWTDDELGERLAASARLSRNFPADEEVLTPARGWRRHFSETIIALEPPGSPVPHGPYVSAWPLVALYAFSDPRIVVGHFDPEVPLLGRRMLLEARVLGLRYLGAVVVGATRQESNAERTVRGYRYDTLEGHFERGYEWFLLSKDHATGEVRFRIQAAWQRGELPNFWSRIGFDLLARRYQRAWHRLAHLRLRVMLGSSGLAPLPRGARLVHEGVDLPAPHVHAVAGAQRRPSIIVEADTLERHPLGGDMADIIDAAALGALTGARSMLGPAVAARVLTSRVRPDVNGAAEWLGAGLSQRVLPVLAAGEMLADKLPGVPPRTDPLPLAGRAAIGALVGSGVAEPGQQRTGALVGAACAVAAAVALRWLRKAATDRLGVPNPVAGVLEDALLVAAGLRLLRSRA